MKKIKQIIFIVSLAILSYLPGIASERSFFIDDFIDETIDNIIDKVDEEFTPFFFRLNDQSSTPKTVSHDPRKIRLKILYKKELSKRFNRLDPLTLEIALNEALSARTQFPGDDFRDDFDQEFNFKLEAQRLKSKINTNYFEAHFISNEIVLDEVQRLVVEIDMTDFMDSIDIVEETILKTPQETLRIRPISLELAESELANINLTQSEDDDLKLASINLKTKFISTEELSPEISDLKFSFVEKAKKHEAFAKAKLKQKNRKMKLEVEPSSEAVINKLSENEYQLNLTANLNLLKFNDADAALKAKKIKASIPVSLLGSTESGLAFRAKGTIKSQLK